MTEAIPETAIDPISEIPWQEIEAEVKVREKVVSRIAAALHEGGINASMEIAATDVFVEKAERALTTRSQRMRMMSRFCLGFLGFVMVLGLATLFGAVPGAISYDSTTTEATILSALHNFAVLGILLGLVYLGASLLRAYLHEATVLENRVHSLRLGRLYVYLKLASVTPDELGKMRDALNAADIERIFGWNIESSTAFKDIRPEYMTKSIVGQVVDAIGKVAQRKG